MGQAERSLPDKLVMAGARQVMRTTIQARQNSQESLDRLAAQRFLYQQAECLELWRLVLILLVVVLLLLGLAVGTSACSQFATLAVLLLWLVDQFVLAPCISRRKEEAAAIQEEFDCFVLDIPWPEHVAVVRPTRDRVEDLRNKAKTAGKASKELANWYGPAAKIPTDAVSARLHCQRINCRWDSELRKKWKQTLCCFVVAMVVVGIAIGAILGVSLLEVVLGAASGLRLLVWLQVERATQTSAYERMKHLHRFLSQKQAESDGASLTDVRLIQAVILEHRRTCPTVPDWFYRLQRKSLEGNAKKLNDTP